jgi:maleamate amidohydrolase
MSELERNYAGVFDGRVGFGRQPALLLVDFIKAYTTPGAPLYAPDVATAVQQTIPLLELCRNTAVPIIYTRVIYNQNGLDGGIFVQKVPLLRGMVEGEPLADIVPELAPTPADVIINKQYASAFFGTALAPMLTSLGVDTLLLTGCSTSGCIRATAVDGMQHGFRVIVPQQCVGDRHTAPHTANLFDINSKYGDVLDKTEVMAYLQNRSVQ